MRKIIAVLLTICMITLVNAQPKKELQAIGSLCGCYEVDFKYAETFAADEEYTFPPRYHVGGMEWVVAEESNDEKTVIQHLLLIDDSTIIKHWREDWVYEQTDWWKFDHDAVWTRAIRNKPDVKGQWTQTVWEVDDAPRYQGSSNWVTGDNKYYWENTTDAPLPRREYTKRKDYNVMRRTNKIFLTDTGWVHEQDNQKIIRNNGTPDVLLAEEKGYNTYRKIDDSKCRAAASWWEKHRSFWKTVRDSWDSILKDKQTLHLIKQVKGQFLFEQLDALEQQHIPAERLPEKLTNLIGQYIGN
jgi:hypothetical protein